MLYQLSQSPMGVKADNYTRFIVKCKYSDEFYSIISLNQNL
jgi:hypothetical protein